MLKVLTHRKQTGYVGLVSLARLGFADRFVYLLVWPYIKLFLGFCVTWGRWMALVFCFVPLRQGITNACAIKELLWSENTAQSHTKKILDCHT